MSPGDQDKTLAELIAEVAAANEAAMKSTAKVEGIQSDLLATTRRVVLLEIALEQSLAKIEALKFALDRISRWPTTHSREAKSMRAIARDALK